MHQALSGRTTQEIPRLEIPDKQIEIFARRLLPEIKRYFANEDVRREFEEWKQERQGGVK